MNEEQQASRDRAAARARERESIRQSIRASEERESAERIARADERLSREMAAAVQRVEEDPERTEAIIRECGAGLLHHWARHELHPEVRELLQAEVERRQDEVDEETIRYRLDDAGEALRTSEGWDHDRRMAVARRAIGWELGDESWAEKIVRAYLAPGVTTEALDVEGAEASS